MDEHYPFFSDIIATIGLVFGQWKISKVVMSAIVILIGAPDKVFLALSIVLIIDVLTGIAKALYTKTFAWYKMRHFAGKWVVYLTLIVLAHQANIISPMYLYWLRGGTVTFVFLTEYKSITENLAVLGFPIPTIKQLRKKLLKLSRGE